MHYRNGVDQAGSMTREVPRMNTKLRLRIRLPGHEEKTAAIDKREISIGRDFHCDVQIDDPEVSSRHALLTVVSSDRVLLSDLGSDSGTYMLDRLVTTETKLAPGASIRIGPAYITLESTGDDSVKSFHLILHPNSLSPCIQLQSNDSRTHSGDIERLLLLMRDLSAGKAGMTHLDVLLSRIADMLFAENGLLLIHDGKDLAERSIRINRGDQLHYPEQLIREVILGRKMVLFPMEWDAIGDTLKERGIGSGICTAIFDGDRSWGAIYLDRGIARKPFTPDDVTLLCRIGNVLGAAFHRELTWNVMNAEYQGLRLEQEKWANALQKKLDTQVKSLNRKYQQILFTALRLSESSKPVVILGENGSGRSNLARRIHSTGARKKHPFIEVDCRNIPLEILEEELFGYEATGDKPTEPSLRGYIEKAHQGTLYLKEFSVLPLWIQSKLHSLLESGKVKRKGAQTAFSVDIRLILSTDVDLGSMNRGENIHPNLYQILKTTVLLLPPLRNRTEDIIPFAKHFLRTYLPKNRTVPEFSADVKDLISRYIWPGNIHELSECMRYITAVCSDQQIELGDLPKRILEQPVTISADNLTFRDQMDRFEVTLIRSALEQHNNIVTRAAKALGLSESTLRYRMQRLNINQ